MRKNSQDTNTTTRATKALVATGLGVVLLAGAGGTFALWGDEEAVATGTITDGELSLTVAAGQWQEGDGTAIADITAYRMVPGDTVTFSTSATPTIVGDNLRATLVGQLPAAPGGDWVVEATVPDGAAVLTATDSGTAIPVSVDVTLPATSGNASQNAVLALNDLTLTLQQVDPTPAG